MNLKKKAISVLFACLLSYGGTLMAQVPYFQEVSTELGIEEVFDVTDLYGNGAAAADYDNDGDIDFYLTADIRNPDRLYRNDGQGQFTNVFLESGIIQTKSNRAALWFDYNGDHRLDLVVVGENCVNRSCKDPVRINLYQQIENFRFKKVTEESGLVIGPDFDNVPYYAIGGLAAADINQDHYLDLLLTVWGGGVKLFKNNTDGTFTDITEEAGLHMEEKTPWQPMFHDFNQDGLIDIYCNVDFTDNILWINRGGVFDDRAAQYGLNHAFNEMGMAMSDYDNDGDLDIYITNITREHQGELQYNILYEQKKVNGRILFKETAQSRGVSQSGWDWGTTFIDINNDGRQDLVTTNGWLKLLWEPDASKMWLNTRTGFVDVSEKCGFNDRLSATTLLAFDMDRDGDMDLLQTLKDNESTKKPLLIYRNNLEDLPNPGNYAVIQPRMEGPNHLAVGSQVSLVAKDLISARLISAGCSFYGQEPAEAFFGLGSRDKVTEVIVRWPTNEVSIYQEIAVNRINKLQYEVIEPPSHLTSIQHDDRIDLQWEDNSTNEDGFVIHRSRDSTFSEYETIDLAADVTFYTDSDLDGSTKYFYRVRGYNARVFSNNSNVISIQTEEPVSVSVQGTSVYPNPIRNNTLTLRSGELYEGPVWLSFFDLTGRELWSAQANKSTAYQEFNYPVEVPSGTYFLSVRMGNLREWHQLVVINK